MFVLSLTVCLYVCIYNWKFNNPVTLFNVYLLPTVILAGGINLAVIIVANCVLMASLLFVLLSFPPQLSPRQIYSKHSHVVLCNLCSFKRRVEEIVYRCLCFHASLRTLCQTLTLSRPGSLYLFFQVCLDG